jgi:hypothetical protein
LITTAEGLRPVVEAKLKNILRDEATEEQVTALAKSCLQPHLAKFEAVNHESCDCTALFGIITHSCNKHCKDLPSHPDLMSEFEKIKVIVSEARKSVRNEWAHCNLSEWTTDKFSSSFETLIELVKAAKCDPKIKKNLKELRDNGVNSLSGSYVNSQLLKSISEGIEELHLTVKHNPDDYPGKEQINKTLNLVEAILEKLDKNHKENMESHRRAQEQNLKNHQENMEEGHQRTREQNLENHRENMEEGHRTTQKLVEDLKVTLL